MTYETVVGLEVHVELSTKSKIFCGCTTKFGGEPNTQICPVCTGMPGVLPTLNKSVVDSAIKTGIALNCSITAYNKFDRKNYFYPDLPKAYQVSQLYLPICQNGFVEISTASGTKKIGIHEIHMEEDAGKLIHDPWDECTLVDYNRCGVPLLEIVSEPDFRTGDEVIAYLEKLRGVLTYLGVSDCKMQEGSMRADINLSVRPLGASEFGTRTEMKNMNSLKSIRRAIHFEALRQIECIESGGCIVQETRRWDDNKDASFAMRSKENAQDYRYFPEPDLLPIEISEDWIDLIQQTLPELPVQKKLRYERDYGLSAYDADIILSAKPLAILFEEVTALCGKPKEAANLIIVELMRLLGTSGTLPEDIHMDAGKMADIIRMIGEGLINRTVGKEVFEALFSNDIDPMQYVQEKGLTMLNNDTHIGEIVDEIIAENQKSVEDYKNGKGKAFGFLVGQAMKKLQGLGNPQTVNKLLKERLEKLGPTD